MHSNFHIETAKAKRACHECSDDILKGEDCFVESYHDGMYVRKDNYHLKCALTFINGVMGKFEKHLKNINNLIYKKST